MNSNDYDEDTLKRSFQNKTMNNKILKKKLKEEKERLKILLKEKKKLKKQTIETLKIIEPPMDFEIIENNTIEDKNISIVEPEKNNSQIEPIKNNLSDEIINAKKLKMLKLSMINIKPPEPLKYKLDETNNKIYFDLMRVNLCIELVEDFYDLDEILFWINNECNAYGLNIVNKNNKIIFQTTESFVIKKCYILSLFGFNNDYEHII